jgi:hypothetical protein
VNELLGSQIAPLDPAIEGDGFDIYSSFQEASTDIEEWTTGDATHRIIEERAPPEEAYICYGTVSGEQVNPEGITFFKSSPILRTRKTDPSPPTTS